MKKKLGFRGLTPPIWYEKCFRIMRLTILFLCVGLMQVSASVYSQNTKLSLELRNSRVVDVLEAIETKSEYRFAYSSEYIDMNRTVNIDVKSQSIERTLAILFNGTDVKYKVNDRHIMLFLEGSEQFDSQQQKSISGKISDSLGSLLPGVTVVIKGTTIGTITDSNGNFSLANVPPNATLMVSFVGMKTQEIAILGKTTINVVLEEETIGVEEVVVVGYGTQLKSLVSSSASSINTDVLDNRPVISVQQALAGVDPGLNISQANGQPGTFPGLTIRGTGTPITLVDGLNPI